MTNIQQNSSASKIRLITITALFMAMIYVLTAFLHVPTTKGYVHIGDGVIFLAASLLPAPFAICASAVGAAMSDALSGYWIWVPATLVIKGLTAAFFTNKSDKILCKRNILAIIPALILCVGGYGLYSGTIIYGSLALGFADSAANAVQTIASTILYVILATTFDKTGMKKKFTNSFIK